MLDRTQRPTVHPTENIEFVEPRTIMLNGTTPLFIMQEVQNETSRIDLYFDAGKNSGERSLSSFVNGLILSGTDKKNSMEINEAINSLGGFYQSGVSMESAVMSIYALKEFLPQLTASLVDAILNVNFDEKEMNEYLADRRQKHRESMGKVSYLAQREFQQRLFASNQLYASVLSEDDIDQSRREDLIEFHKNHYINGLYKVVIVGDIDENELEKIERLLHPLTYQNISTKEDQFINEKGEFHVEKKGAMQTAIRIGRSLFNKKHPDYLDFLVVNTILGDYFGSRLMSNIREDKGYTYGIGSAVNEFYNTGYFMIGTEVKKEVTEDTLKEVRYELERLQNEPVGFSELELVKNYLLGQLLKSADGPYAMMDLYLSAEIQGKDLEFYNEAIDAIKKITPERIQELAKKYLNWEDLTVVTAG